MYICSKKVLLLFTCSMFFSTVMPYSSNHYHTVTALSPAEYHWTRFGEALGECIGGWIERSQRRKAIGRLLGDTPEARMKAREIVKLPLYLQETFIKNTLAEKEAEQLRIKQLEEEKKADDLRRALETRDRELQEHWRLKIINWLIIIFSLLGVSSLVGTIICFVKRKRKV